MTDMERLLNLVRAQLLSDPDATLALISSQQPNLCQFIPMSMVFTLAPFATTTITSDIPEGFISVFVIGDLYTDVPFAVQILHYKDDALWYVDPGLVPMASRLRNWATAAFRLSVTYINMAAVTVNIHSGIGLYLVETETFKNIMNHLKPLSYSMSEHGTPEYAEPIIRWEMAEK